MAQLIRHRDENPSDLQWISQRWQQPILRSFWLYNVPSSSQRGGHRHQADCQMVLHCPVGSVRVYVQTPTQDHVFRLQSSHEYLFLTGSDWRLMDSFSPNTVLTVLSSHCFETTNYIDQPYRPVTVSVNELGPSFKRGSPVTTD